MLGKGVVDALRFGRENTASDVDSGDTQALHPFAVYCGVRVGGCGDHAFHSVRESERRHMGLCVRDVSKAQA